MLDTQNANTVGSTSVPSSPRLAAQDLPRAASPSAVSDHVAPAKTDASRPATPTVHAALSAPGSRSASPASATRQAPEPEATAKPGVDNSAVGTLKARITQGLSKTSPVKASILRALRKVGGWANEVRTITRRPAVETAIYAACTVVVAACSIAMFSLCSGAALLAPAIGITAMVILCGATFLSYRNMRAVSAAAQTPVAAGDEAGAPLGEKEAPAPL